MNGKEHLPRIFARQPPCWYFQAASASRAWPHSVVRRYCRAATSLPHQPEEPVIKSGDPGDTEYQGDSERCLRTDVIEDASEVEHDTGPCFSLFWVSIAAVRPMHFDGYHIWRFIRNGPASRPVGSGSSCEAGCFPGDRRRTSRCVATRATDGGSRIRTPLVG